MAALRYEKWRATALHPHDDPHGEPIGARIHDHADGTVWDVMIGQRKGKPIITSLTVTPGSGEIDQAPSVPVTLLREFAVDAMRRAQARPDVIQIDATDAEVTEDELRQIGRELQRLARLGLAPTMRPEHLARLRRFANYYNTLKDRQTTKGGRVRARRQFLVYEPESPYFGKSEGWIDKQIGLARRFGWIDPPTKGRRNDLETTEPNPGPDNRATTKRGKKS